MFYLGFVYRNLREYLTYKTFEVPPNTLNRIQIWGIRRPVEDQRDAFVEGM
jgi:hypothetical protein